MGKTFLSLFSSFEKSELCQLYIYPSVPDVDICQSYYRVTDRDVLNGYFHFGKVASRVLQSEDIDTTHSFFETEQDENFLRSREKKPVTLLCRDLLWRFSLWYSKKLKDWLTEQKPTCIFLAPGESKFIYDIALRISKELKIPIVVYLCDEFYFIKYRGSVLKRLQLFLLKRKMEKTIQRCKSIVGICDELSAAYSEHFNKETCTIHNGCSSELLRVCGGKEKIGGISYFGNLSLGRFESVCDIGEALDAINRKTGEELKLSLYTPILEPEAKKRLDSVSSVELCGFVTGEQYREAFLNSDLLLHVESFSEENAERVRHSISTKIADSLGSGIPLIAYGPADVASVHYLAENDCALVISRKQDVENMLFRIISSESDRKRIVENALFVADSNHRSLENSRKLRSVLLKVSAQREMP